MSPLKWEDMVLYSQYLNMEILIKTIKIIINKKITRVEMTKIKIHILILQEWE